MKNSVFFLFFCASTSLFLPLSFFHFLFFCLSLSLSLSLPIVFSACNFLVFFFLSSLFLNFLPNQPQTCKIEKHYKTPPCRRTLPAYTDIYIYMHIQIYIYRCAVVEYLVQFVPFCNLISGPSFLLVSFFPVPKLLLSVGRRMRSLRKRFPNMMS